MTYLLDVEDEQVEAEECLERLHALLELELTPVAEPIPGNAFRKQLQAPLALLNRPLTARHLTDALEDLSFEVYLENLAPGIQITLCQTSIQIIYYTTRPTHFKLSGLDTQGARVCRDARWRVKVRCDACGLCGVCYIAREVLQRTHEIRVDHAKSLGNRLERRREQLVELGVVYERDDDLARGASGSGDLRGVYRIRVRVRDGRRGRAWRRWAINTPRRARKSAQMSVPPQVVSQ